MKTAATIILFFCAIHVFAQQPSEKDLKRHRSIVERSRKEGFVTVSLDTIFNKGIPYAVMKSIQKTLNNDYVVYSLSGKEAINIPFECVSYNKSITGRQCYRAFIFTQSGKRAEVPYSFELNVAKFIVENDLMSEAGVKPDSENKLLLRYPPQYSSGLKQDGK